MSFLLNFIAYSRPPGHRWTWKRLGDGSFYMGKEELETLVSSITRWCLYNAQQSITTFWRGKKCLVSLQLGSITVNLSSRHQSYHQISLALWISSISHWLWNNVIYKCLNDFREFIIIYWRILFSHLLFFQESFPSFHTDYFILL